MSTSSSTSVSPRILSVRYDRGRGIEVQAQYRCGHTQRVVFPQAARRTSVRQLSEWAFGWNGDELCSACQREAQS